MKKYLFLATLASVALASCVNDESNVAMEAPQPLRFDAPVIGTQTRANVAGEIEGLIYPANEDFMVYCYHYKSGTFGGWNTNDTEGFTDYFNGAIRTQHNGSAANPYWNTVGKEYTWPGVGYSLAFAAYSPADLNDEAEVTYDDKGLSIANFKTETNSSNQYDLLYSDRTLDRTNENNGNSAVTIKFKHALASIVFSVQDAVENKIYTLKKVEVKGNFQTEGNFC